VHIYYLEDQKLVAAYMEKHPFAVVAGLARLKVAVNKYWLLLMR
jgi:hypothetical protein